MSIATIERAPLSAVAPAPAAPTDAPRLRAVPAGTEARGFVLYVGIDEAKAAAAGTDLGALVEKLKALVGDLAGDPAGVELRHRDLADRVRAVGVGVRGAVDELPRGGDHLVHAQVVTDAGHARTRRHQRS